MTTAAQKKKELAAKNENTALVQAGMYEEDADSGFEQANADAYAIPFLTILQSGSPQCKKSEGAHIEGAEEGQLFNTVAEECFDGDKGFDIVPVHYKRAFVEWQPRETGGGFVAEHNEADGLDLLKQCTKNDSNQDILPNGNLLVDTRSHYVLVLDENGVADSAVIAMSSTQMKKSRRWMTVMQNLKMKRGDGSSFTPPMFSHRYSLTSVPESNDKGSWYGWKITIGEQVADINLYNAAKSFREAILSGEAKDSTPAAVASNEAEEF